MNNSNFYRFSLISLTYHYNDETGLILAKPIKAVDQNGSSPLGSHAKMGRANFIQFYPFLANPAQSYVDRMLKQAQMGLILKY